MKRWTLLVLLALAGCDLSMTRQARHEAQSSPMLWPDGPPATGAPEGAIARDLPAREAALAHPPTLTLALLQRGRERYTIYCAPCHGGSGGGDGVVVARGFPRPPAFTERKLADISPARIVDVETHGYGVMYDFSDRIEPADRWAIAAYVKVLQRAHAEAGRP